MSVVMAYQDLPHQRPRRDLPGGYLAWRTDFFERPAPDVPGDCPMAFLAEGSPGSMLRTHFHYVDQFQVTYLGTGTLGAHAMDFGSVHFSRAYTPYGPIRYSKDAGLGFITLRAHRDKGARYLPERRELLESARDRKPWQITVMPDFDSPPGESGVTMKALDGLRDERGLAGFSLVLRPGAGAWSIDPSRGDGQYILVMRGGILHEGQHKKDLTIIWVGHDEKPFHITAGPQGAQILILNFPAQAGAARKASPGLSAAGGAFKAHQCMLCAFVYDEAEGHAETGIAPGTRWADVPDAFQCPDCEARKSCFRMIEF